MSRPWDFVPELMYGNRGFANEVGNARVVLFGTDRSLHRVLVWRWEYDWHVVQFATKIMPVLILMILG